MRKRTAKFIFEKLMWGIIMFLPVIGFFGQIYGRMTNAYEPTQDLASINQTEGPISMTTNFDIYMETQAETWSSWSGGNIRETNIYKGMDEIRKLIANDQLIAEGVLIWITYIIIIEILHLATDVLLFIPRWAHHTMDNFLTKTEG